MKYTLMHPVVTCAVPGIRTMEQLLELTKETPRLNEMEYEQLTAAVPVKDYTLHV
jgi:hypothetical protein